MATLNDIISTFTESDLNLTVPLELQDISEADLAIVNTYNAYLANSDYASATSYRNEHPELEKYILDVKKYNILQAFIMNAFLYAKSQKQQCEFNTSQPDNQISGDIWLKKITNSETGNEWYTPYYLTDTNGYKEFSLTISGYKIVKLTQTEYNALTTKDENTIYFTTN